MLIEFTVGNYLSFKEPVTFSLEASEDEEFRETNVFSKNKYDLLKSAVIYGANSSGKSNLLLALNTMKSIVLTSFDKSSNSKLEIVPFLLHVDTEYKPSYFQVIFTKNNKVYSYSINADNEKIHEEKLAEIIENKETIKFHRVLQKIEVFDELQDFKGYESRTRENALFLNVLDQFASKTASEIVGWFKNSLVIGFEGIANLALVTEDMTKNTEDKKRLISFYNKLNLGFNDLVFETQTIDSGVFPKNLPKELIDAMLYNFIGKESSIPKTYHNQLDSDGNVQKIVKFDLNKNESQGTVKIVTHSGAMFETLTHGKTLIIDELDASLHQLLTLEIIKLFHSKETNPNNAQLIFTTHDASLLKKDLLKEEANFRNDQVYFVEKDRYEASKLTSLYDYDLTDLNVTDLDQQYLLGRFGAIPYIDSSTISVSTNG